MLMDGPSCLRDAPDFSSFQISILHARRHKVSFGVAEFSGRNNLDLHTGESHPALIYFKTQSVSFPLGEFSPLKPMAYSRL